MDLPDDILILLIDLVRDELCLVNKKFLTLCISLIPSYKKLIPLDTTNYSLRAVMFSRKFHFKYYKAKDLYTLGNTVHIALSNSHQIYLDSNGKIHCYGFNQRYQLGHNSEPPNFNNIIYVWTTTRYSILLDNIGRIYHAGDRSILNQDGYNQTFNCIDKEIIDAFVSDASLVLYRINGKRTVYEIQI
jgi:hypothetical protein